MQELRLATNKLHLTVFFIRQLQEDKIINGTSSVRRNLPRGPTDFLVIFSYKFKLLHLRTCGGKIHVPFSNKSFFVSVLIKLFYQVLEKTHLKIINFLTCVEKGKVEVQ